MVQPSALGPPGVPGGVSPWRACVSPEADSVLGLWAILTSSSGEVCLNVLPVFPIGLSS